MRSLREGRQPPAVSRNAPKVGPMFVCHGSYALLEVGASTYQRRDPAERHTSKYLPPVRTRPFHNAKDRTHLLINDTRSNPRTDE